MHDLFIDGTTECVREPHVPLESRNNPVLSTEVVRYFFKVPGCDSGSHPLPDFVENGGSYTVGFPEYGDFLIIFQEYAPVLFQPCLPLIFALASRPSYLPEMRCDWTCAIVSMATPTTMSSEVPP